MIGTGDGMYARGMVQQYDLPFRVLLDEDGQAAQAAAVQRVSIWKLFHPSSYGATYRTWKAGYKVGKAGKRVDQLGASFVLGPDSEVLYQYYDEHTADHAHAIGLPGLSHAYGPDQRP